MGNRRHRMIVLILRLAVLAMPLSCAFLSGCTGVPKSFSFLTKPFSKDEAEGTTMEDLGPTIAYEVKLDISGPADGNERLRDFLAESSTSMRLQDRPTATLAGLQRRAEEDVERFTAVLQSFGYYDGKVSFAIQTKNGAGELPGDAATAPGLPVVVLFQIESGPPYLLSAVLLEVIRPDLTVRRPMKDSEMELAGLTSGKPAEAEAIIQAEQQAVSIIRAGGYPLAHAGERKVTANTAEKTLRVTYEIFTGEKANFGPITVKGAAEVDPGFIAGYRTWQQGEIFSPEEIARTQRELAASNLFLAASVRPADAVKEGEIPIEMEVTERKHRTIGGGIDYSTADGFGANGFWEHRNLFGAGERLRMHLEGSQLQYGFETDFTKPQFLRRQQNLVADGQGKEFTTDAYEGYLADGFVGIERKFWEHWAATLGVTAEYSDLTGPDSPNEYFFLGGLRSKLRRDSTANPLDPVDGSRMELTLSPLISLSGASTQFVSLLLTGSKYQPLDDDRRYVLAGRARAGTIWGDDRSSLPSHRRFYAGGGGSIRGYEYQKVGPLDEDNDPIGGRSLVEVGLELRARVTESIGVVPFIEGGNVFESPEPEDLELLWAAGLGLRYYTAVGPLRLDFAVPLDQRDFDDDYQIYISIGQAF